MTEQKSCQKIHGIIFYQHDRVQWILEILVLLLTLPFEEKKKKMTFIEHYSVQMLY